MRRAAIFLVGLVLAACGPGDGSGTSATTSATTATAPSAASTAASTTTPPPLETSPDVAAAFAAVTADNGVRRWEAAQVTIAWHGAPSPDDRSVLDAALVWLGDIAGMPDLVLLADGADADVELHVVPQDQWAPVVGDVAPEDWDVTAGLTLARWDEASGAMTAADVAIDAALPQVRRNHTIVHELLHAVGLGHHECAGGLVYGGRDGTPTWTPTPFDLAVLALDYDPTIPGGADALTAGTRVLATRAEPVCPPVVWTDVTAPDGSVLWCERERDPARCYAPTPATEPVASAEPDVWASAGTLTVYDPSRYVAYDSPEGPVLCEIPVPGVRTPCQRGADLRRVEVAELWTDGEVLYTEP